MSYLGILIIALGAWIAYAQFYGINPAKTGIQILQNPQKAEAILTDARIAAQKEIQTVLATTKGSSQTSGGGTGAVAAPGGDGGTVVAFARAQVGKPYRFGGSGPDAWDCSGLVQAAYKLVRINVPHSALAQSLRGVHITEKSALAAGDLLFPTGRGVAAIGDHVQIYSGNNSVIEAANPDSGVREIALSWWWPTDKVVACRYIKAPTVNTPQAGQNKTAGNYYG